MTTYRLSAANLDPRTRAVTADGAPIGVAIPASDLFSSAIPGWWTWVDAAIGRRLWGHMPSGRVFASDVKPDAAVVATLAVPVPSVEREDRAVFTLDVGRPSWRTEAARAGIKPWPYCRRTMANLDGRAVEVPDLGDGETLAAFDVRLGLRFRIPEPMLADGVIVTVMGADGPWPTLGIRPAGATATGHACFVSTGDPLLARVQAWASVTPTYSGIPVVVDPGMDEGTIRIVRLT